MALTSTTLASAKGLNDLTINLTSATGAAKKMLALVDGEFMRITDVSLSPVLGVVPGYAGTMAGPHGTLAPVVYGLPSDFTNIGIVPDKGRVVQTLSFGKDGAITGRDGTGVPVNDCIVYLNKATAGAYTLAAPAADQQNTITFISTTAAAHTITYTAGFYGNTTSSDVVTFPSTINGCFLIKAQNGTWAPLVGGGTTGNVTGPA